MNSCYQCGHCFKDVGSWEMPHIWWWVCAARPGMPNLKSFPFRSTTCSKWVASKNVENRKPSGLDFQASA